MLPCSFDEKGQYAVQLRQMSIVEAWNNPEFGKFRERLRTACPECKNQALCKGGYPFYSSIAFCNSENRTTGEKENEIQNSNSVMASGIQSQRPYCYPHMRMTRTLQMHYVQMTKEL